MSLALYERRLAAVEARIAPPPAAMNPVELARRANFFPDPWQADVLTERPKRGLLNCSRQSGKSTTAAALAVWEAVFAPGSLTLLLSPTLRQSGELFKKCLACWRALGRPIGARSETALSVELLNDSRIVSLPGVEASIRSYSAPRLIIADEAARIPNDLFVSVLPMLAVSDGDFLAMSTPFGRRGWWAEAWLGGDPTWRRWEVPATDCPRISPEVLIQMERTMGAWWYSQEFLCHFLDAQTAAFRQEDIDAAFVEGIDQWHL